MNIMVTGGAGYIGSCCCKELYNQGYNPITFDNLVHGIRENVKWGDFFKGDIGNEKDLITFFNRYKIDAVFHFAAHIFVDESVINPKKYYLNNLQNTIILLQHILKNNIKYFIFSSTCAVYGVPNKIPIDENHSKFPINPYGKAKKMVEDILKDYSNAYDFKFISLRYFNAAGEKHNSKSHLIPIILDAIKKNKNLNVFGDDYDTVDGSCIRDYIHISDLATAHILALEKLMNDNQNNFYNLGTGKGYSVLEIIKKISKITGKKIPFIIVDKREGDAPILIASNEKAVKELGWKPQYNIEDIIRTV
jgi:UDP-glucose 4-epimerase